MTLLKHKLFFLSWIGCLTFLAGAMNISAILLFSTTITHHTGNISKAAIALGSGDMNSLWALLGYMGLFSIGSVISGFLFYERTQGMKIMYTLLPIMFGIVLYITLKLTTNENILLQTIAFGMGLQNGTFIKIRGILVRTTHMTGYLTDAAFSLGAVLHGNVHELWRFLWYFFSILIFFTGGIVATLLVSRIGIRTLSMLATVYVLVGIYVAVGYPTTRVAKLSKNL